MIERIQQLLTAEHLTAPQLAERLGVQRSAISHILLGRNKPSFDMLHRFAVQFPKLNIGWLITGQGEMYGQNNAQSELVTTVSEPFIPMGGTDDECVPNAALRATVPSSETYSDDAANDHNQLPMGSLFDNPQASAAPKPYRKPTQKSAPSSFPLDTAASLLPSESVSTGNSQDVNHAENQLQVQDTNINSRVLSGTTIANSSNTNTNTSVTASAGRVLQRVLLLYSDGSFDDYSPKK